MALSQYGSEDAIVGILYLGSALAMDKAYASKQCSLTPIQCDICRAEVAKQRIGLDAEGAENRPAQPNWQADTSDLPCNAFNFEDAQEGVHYILHED